MPAHVSLVGERFHRLFVIRKSDRRDKWNRILWICLCDCGKFLDVLSGSLRNGHTRSCGCLQKDHAVTVNFKHGHTKFREYKIWKGMIERCYNTDHISYKEYGGKGIRMSEEWLSSFINFYNDVGPRPSDGHTIDRIEGSKNYCKGNCRWATWEEQANNRSNNVLYTYQNETLTISQIAKKIGVEDFVLRTRLSKGMAIEEAVNSSLKARKNKKT